MYPPNKIFAELNSGFISANWIFPTIGYIIIYNSL